MPSKSKQGKTAPTASKRGRGRPSKLEAQLASTSAFLDRAIVFIQSLQTKEGDEWLEREGQLTAMQLAEIKSAANAEKRAELEKTINDTQLELAALGVPCTVTMGEGSGVKIRTTDCA